MVLFESFQAVEHWSSPGADHRQNEAKGTVLPFSGFPPRHWPASIKNASKKSSCRVAHAPWSRC